ncbi:MAG: tetratricopeptide repeat protein, partial [Spirochaetota bacterium]
SLKYYYKAVKHSKENQNNKLLADSYLNMSNSYLRMGDSAFSLGYIRKAIQNYKELNDTKGITEAYLIIAHLYDRLGKQEKEREYLFKSLNLTSSYKVNPDTIARIYNSIGVSYANQSLLEEGLEYYHKSLDITEEYYLPNLQVLLSNNVGDIYRQKGEYDLALKYLHNALMLLEEINNKELECVVLYNISIIYYKKEDFELAIYFLRKGNKLTTKYNLAYAKTLIKGYRAYLNIKKGHIKKSLKDIKSCLDINQYIKFDPLQGLIYTALGLILEKKPYKEFPEKGKKLLEKVIAQINNIDDKFNPESYFKKAIEKSSLPMLTDTHIPALYEYARFLYTNLRFNEAYEKFNEALKLSIKFGNYSERDTIINIINELKLDMRTFCDNIKK